MALIQQYSNDTEFRLFDDGIGEEMMGRCIGDEEGIVKEVHFNAYLGVQGMADCGTDREEKGTCHRNR